MPTASKPSAVAARKVANCIAEQEPACLDPYFMDEVNAYLQKRGLYLIGLCSIVKVQS